jgi:hypothetical protein
MGNVANNVIGENPKGVGRINRIALEIRNSFLLLISYYD